ncbi:MAG TPA: nucleotide-binding protein [Melioribacteraceae bacterium]|nr:nucleotide-binding protein [Melioribacteraceae bacterium]
MENKSIVFAKLAGTYKTLQSLLSPQGNRDRLVLNFNPSQVREVFNDFSKLLTQLKELFPSLYSDVPERVVPEPTEGGSIGRDFLETIKRDMDYIFELNAQLSVNESKEIRRPGRIFISHGSSKDWMQIQNYIEKDLLIDTLELAQEPNKGRTVLQKLNEESEKCSYSVVVMTGDDIISEGEVRARENVMHEIGFFQGKYGLEKVCLLYEEGTNIPSNIHGLVYIPFPKNVVDAVFGSLSRELKVYFK